MIIFFDDSWTSCRWSGCCCPRRHHVVAGSVLLPRAHNGQRRGTANGLRRPGKLRYAAAGLLVRRCVRSSMLLCLVRLCPRPTARPMAPLPGAAAAGSAFLRRVRPSAVRLAGRRFTMPAPVHCAAVGFTRHADAPARPVLHGTAVCNKQVVIIICLGGFTGTPWTSRAAVYGKRVGDTRCGNRNTYDTIKPMSRVT